MATHTLKAKYETKDDSTGHVRQVFCAYKDQKEIYYQFEDELEANSESDAPAEVANPSPTPVATVPVVVATPPPTISGPAASIEDAPIRAVDILAVIVSQKLKKQLSEVPLFKSIKELSNGKSTLQNEIMGDLQGEFSSAPDKVRSFRWRSLALPSDLVTLAISANILLVSCCVPLVARCLVASIFQVQNLISPRHGVWVPNVPMPCYSLLPPWSPLNALVPKQRAKSGSMLLHKRMLNVWASLFSLAAAAVPLKVLPEELS